MLDPGWRRDAMAVTGLMAVSASSCIALRRRHVVASPYWLCLPRPFILAAEPDFGVRSWGMDTRTAPIPPSPRASFVSVLLTGE